MSIARLFLGRILRFFQFIAGLLKRALCFMRKREHIGELPFTVTPHSQSAAHAVNPAPESANWGSEFQWNEKTIVEDKIDQWRRSKETQPSRDQSHEPDFFNDMVPDIKRTKKVILKSKNPSQPSGSSATSRDLFAFQGEDVAPVGGELGELNEAEAWEDGISSTLNELRLQKQRARHEEYDRRMQERRGLYGQS